MARVSEDGDGDGRAKQTQEMETEVMDIFLSRFLAPYNYRSGSSPKKPGIIDIYAVLAGMGANLLYSTP